MPGALPETLIAPGALPGNVAGALEGSVAETEAPGLTALFAQGACVGLKPPPGGGCLREEVEAAGRPGELGTALGGVMYARNVVSFRGGLISSA